jgi:hypothetical protein
MKFQNNGIIRKETIERVNSLCSIKQIGAGIGVTIREVTIEKVDCIPGLSSDLPMRTSPTAFINARLALFDNNSFYINK